MSVRIALVTDIHLGPDTGNVRGPEALALLESFASEARALQPDLLVDLGDRVTDQSPAQDLENLRRVSRVFGGFVCPRVHLLGNHDLLDRSQQEGILRTRLSSHALEVGGWNLVFLDTFDGTIGGRVTPEAVAWLEGALARSSLPAVVFSHQPLHGQPMTGNVYFEKDFADHACPEGCEAARQALEGSGKVRLCVSGHAHWNDVQSLNGIPYVTVQSLSESVYTEGLAAGAWAWFELAETIRVAVHGRAPVSLEFGSSEA